MDSPGKFRSPVGQPKAKSLIAVQMGGGTAAWRNGYACTTDWLRPILRGAYTGGEEQTQPGCQRRSVFCSSYEPRAQRTGNAQRGRAQTVSGHRPPSECGWTGSAPRSGRSRSVPGAWQGPYLVAATRPGTAHDHGKDRRIPAPGQLVSAITR